MSKKRVGGIAIVVSFIALFFLSSKSLFCMNNNTYKNEIKIAFISTRNNERGIYLMNSDGSNQVRIIKDDNVSYCKFSPDGKNLLFRTNRDGNWEIYLMDLDGSNMKNLTNNKADDISPTFVYFRNHK